MYDIKLSAKFVKNMKLNKNIEISNLNRLNILNHFHLKINYYYLNTSNDHREYCKIMSYFFIKMLIIS
jgi:hypothetical protein